MCRMRNRVLVLPLLLLLTAAAPAQSVSKWILGRGLHVRLPGDPSAGGVPWAQGGLGLPTSWSAEGEGTRIEIAENSFSRGETEAMAQMSKALPGAGSVQKFSVSTYPAYLASANGARVLAIQTPSRTWVALAKGSDAIGMEVLRSITVERDGPQNWQRRFNADIGIRSFLPYHWAVDLSAPSSPDRKDYELKFDGFSMSASVQTVGEGKVFDLKKTVDQDIATLKGDKRYEGLKFKRIRIKEVKDGEIVTYDYKEKGRAKVQYFLVGRNASTGAGTMLRWTYDLDNQKHLDYSNRFIFGMEQPKFDNRGTIQTWKAEKYGLSIEVPQPLESTKSGDGMDEWALGTGGMVVTARVVDYQGESNPGAVTELLDVSFKAMQNAKEYTSSTVPFMVSGMDGKLLKAKFKLSGNSWNYRYGLVVQTLGRTYVIDVLASDQDTAERIVESVRIQLRHENPNLRRHVFKNSSFSVLTLKATNPQDFPDEATWKSQQLLQLVEQDQFAYSAFSQVATTGVASPQPLVKATANEFVKAFKGKVTFLNEGWAMDGEAISYWAAYTIDVNGKKFPGYTYLTVNGKDTLTQTAIYLQPSQPSAKIIQVLMNSYSYP